MQNQADTEYLYRSIERYRQLLPTHGRVYCPSCEAGVEPASKFCLSCGNDLTVRGPITATGHDLNQLKDVIRTRDDLSMAEKFDMIAKVEEGANPILLGIAAPADDDEVDIGEAFAAGESENIVESAFANYQFGESALHLLLLEQLCVN